MSRRCVNTTLPDSDNNQLGSRELLSTRARVFPLMPCMGCSTVVPSCKAQGFKCVATIGFWGVCQDRGKLTGVEITEGLRGWGYCDCGEFVMTVANSIAYELVFVVLWAVCPRACFWCFWDVSPWVCLVTASKITAVFFLQAGGLSQGCAST